MSSLFRPTSNNTPSPECWASKKLHGTNAASLCKRSSGTCATRISWLYHSQLADRTGSFHIHFMDQSKLIRDCSQSTETVDTLKFIVTESNSSVPVLVAVEEPQPIVATRLTQLTTLNFCSQSVGSTFQKEANYQ